MGHERYIHGLSLVTSLALIVVGVILTKTVAQIRLDDFTEAIPSFLVIIGIPFTYSIATGIAVGFIFFPFMKALSGRYREINWIVWVLAILFIVRFVYISWNQLHCTLVRENWREGG